MGACERCWEEASGRTLLFGGSTVEHYNEILSEQQENPTCPKARAVLHGDEEPKS